MPEAQPLYARVRKTLVDRLVDREWHAGDVLPAEPELARELGVSQGTLRKAVDSLCADGALDRVQGRGTFVTEQTPELARARFFRLRDADGVPVATQLQRQIAGDGMADEAAADALGIPLGARVHILDRVRSVAGQAALVEHIVVPEAMMPGLSSASPLPDELYPLYQARFGIHVVRAEETLCAMPASARSAKAIGIPVGRPVLNVTRVAFALDGMVAEYRVSVYLTEGCAYRVDLG